MLTIFVIVRTTYGLALGMLQSLTLLRHFCLDRLSHLHAHALLDTGNLGLFAGQ